MTFTIIHVLVIAFAIACIIQAIGLTAKYNRHLAAIPDAKHYDHLRPDAPFVGRVLKPVQIPFGAWLVSVKQLWRSFGQMPGFASAIHANQKPQQRPTPPISGSPTANDEASASDDSDSSSSGSDAYGFSLRPALAFAI